MADVEFLNEGEWPTDGRGRPRSSALRPRPTRADLLAAGGWAVAAILLMVAPFRSVIYVSTRGTSYATGGWGDDEMVSGGFTAPLFGVALTVCAVALATMAVLRFCISGGLGPVGCVQTIWRWLPRFSLAVPCFLTGVIASTVLYGQNYIDNIERQRQNAGGSTGGPAIHFGGCVWLPLLALVLSAVAPLGTPKSSQRADPSASG
jgi:hypothetical protein